MTQIEQSAVPAGALPTGESPVIERMRGLRSRWPSGSGVAVFNEACLGVVERAGPDFGGRGPDDCDTAPLGVRCAERCLSAAETATAGGRPPECRRPLLPYRRHPGVRPLQFALSGLQAHIGHDRSWRWWKAAMRSAALRRTSTGSSSAWAISSCRWRSGSTRI